MSFTHNTTTAVIALSLGLAAALPAQAEEKYAFPSVSGAMIASTSAKFAPPASPQGEAQVVAPGVGTLAAKSDRPPLPIGSPDYKSRFGMRAQSSDAYGYRFLTHALASQSFANYAADYYRLFTPGYAVTAWTDRVAGFVETGYGSAIDSWTGGAYYLGRARGPAVRRETKPDLSTMPEFRPHPELQTHPTFDRN